MRASEIKDNKFKNISDVDFINKNKKNIFISVLQNTLVSKIARKDIFL
jgi:hypothetical protein